MKVQENAGSSARAYIDTDCSGEIGNRCMTPDGLLKDRLDV